MQLLSLLPLASLAVAAPFGKRSSCLAQQWNIQQFEVFLAGNTSTTASHLSFYFDDPNFGIRAECSRGMKLGATPMNGPGSFADFNWYPCAGGATYRLEGLEKKEGFVTIKRTGVECGNVTYNVQGSVTVNLIDYGIFGGTQYEAVTQTNFNGNQLTETGG